MLDFLSIITMFLFVHAVFSAVVPSAASSAVGFSSVVPTFVPRSDVFCASRGNSTAPEPSPNSLSGFTEDVKYDQLAQLAPIPTDYALTMSNAKCAFSSTGYMLYVQLDSYNPETCAELCNRHEGCDSFNIYIQRNPSVIPGPACPNPAPIFVTKCALYSEPGKVSSCTNFGQYVGPVDADDEAFKVAIRGSNAYNKVSIKQVYATVTTTITKTVHHNGRRARTVFLEPSSADYDGTTTVTIPKATAVCISPETDDATASVVTVTSYNNYYVGTTTITSGELSSTTTVFVTFSGTNAAAITGPVITITPQSPDTTTTVLASQQTEYTTVASTVTVTLPASTVTITSAGADITTTIYEKRDIAANQFKGKEDGAERWDSWTKEWLPANMGTVRPPLGPSKTVTVYYGVAAAANLATVVPRDVADNILVVPTPITLSGVIDTTTVIRTRSTATISTEVVFSLSEPFTIPAGTYTDTAKAISGSTAPTTTHTVYAPGDTPAPMKTITLDDSYTYTGPTDVPMKTITLRA